MTDPTGHSYEIKFDPPANPEMSSGAEVIGAPFYHAFGYNTVDGYLAQLDPDRLAIADGATIYDLLSGKKRPLEMRDIHDVLKRAARQPDGKYRVLASRFADGKPLGNFRYYRSRPDDPNDLVPHEHRRELRGSRVFGAWLNHVDSRDQQPGHVGQGRRPRLHQALHVRLRRHVGSGTLAGQAPRVGNEYIWESKPGWKTLGTWGVHPALMHIDYPHVPPAVGGLRRTRSNPCVGSRIPQPRLRQHAPR
jgi:hypothetical protein